MSRFNPQELNTDASFNVSEHDMEYCVTEAKAKLYHRVQCLYAQYVKDGAKDTSFMMKRMIEDCKSNRLTHDEFLLLMDCVACYNV